MNETTNPSFNKTLLKLALILLVFAAIFAGLYLYKENGDMKTGDKNIEEFLVSKSDLADNQIPSGFPADLPQEAGAKILQNYEAPTNDGRFQSTRVMTTVKPTEAALKTYTDYFLNLGWVEALGRKSTDKTVLMLKGDNSLLISVNEDSSQMRTVNLTLTELR